MDYEKKYKAALERAKEILECSKKLDSKEVRMVLSFFPELKEESEDERIRKKIIATIHLYYGEPLEDEAKEMIDWLEKQGKNNTGISEATKQKLEDNLNKALEKETTESWNEFIEKQVEQKSVNDLTPQEAMDIAVAKCFEQGEHKHKIQPKFKIGDIIRFKGNKTLKGETEAHEIVSYDNELYVFDDGTTDLFCEQDLYELVEQKPAWSEEAQEEQVSEEFINALDTMLNDGLPDRYLVSEERIKKSAELLFSIARKQLKIEMQEWNKEDENNISFLTSIIEECFKDKEKITLYSDTVCAHFTKEDVIDRLNSLRPKTTWKPSEEQMNLLKELVEDNNQRHFYTILRSLYEQLKKLKG